MVLQHARAVACGIRVDWHFARPPAECPNPPEENVEVRGREWLRGRLDHSVDLRCRGADEQKWPDPEHRLVLADGNQYGWLDGFILLDFLVEIQAKRPSPSRCHSRKRAAATGTTAPRGSHRPFRAVCRRRRLGRCEGANPPSGGTPIEPWKIRKIRLGTKRDLTVRATWNRQNLSGSSDCGRIRP